MQDNASKVNEKNHNLNIFQRKNSFLIFYTFIFFNREVR